MAQGCGHEFGVDYSVYAPVARMDTIWLMIIIIVAHRAWEIFQMEMKSAFLYVTLLEFYVQQPQGYVIKNSEHKAYKLAKDLYRLKQAPKAWFNCIETNFIDQGFKRST